MLRTRLAWWSGVRRRSSQRNPATQHFRSPAVQPTGRTFFWVQLGQSSIQRLPPSSKLPASSEHHHQHRQHPQPTRPREARVCPVEPFPARKSEAPVQFHAPIPSRFLFPAAHFFLLALLASCANPQMSNPLIIVPYFDPFCRLVMALVQNLYLCPPLRFPNSLRILYPDGLFYVFPSLRKTATHTLSLHE
jgi:hypothetical protein